MGVVIRIAVLALVVACTNPKGAFECADNEACRNGADLGVCTPAGFCSFADASCPNGYRYGDAAGSLANQCVDASGGDGGIDGSPDTVVLGTWSDRTSLPARRYSGAGVAVGKRIYMLGGILGTTAFANVTLGNVVGGAVSWAETTALPTERRAFGAASNGPAVFAIGGRTPMAADTPDVLAAAINSDGTLGAWQPTMALPTGVRCHSVVSSGTYVYVVGGKAGTTAVPDVLVGTMSGATITQWRQAGLMPKPIGCGAAVISGNYLYVIGGCVRNVVGCVAGDVLAEVHYAQIKTDGTLGAFTATTALPMPRWHHAVAVTNGRIAVATGDDDVAKNTTAVVTAAAQANGALGSWRPENALPRASNGREVMVVADGHVFVIGADTQSAPFQ